MNKPCKVTRLLLAWMVMLCASTAAIPQPLSPAAFIEDQLTAHPGRSGAYVLDTGAEALIARAWLADHARQTIEAQYFIWSTDNIGILAAEALLRAAERGVRVRVIVDALLIDAPDVSLLALARHPNIDIRVYNPTTSRALPWYSRMGNVVTDFRAVNQRMHDKTFVVDGKFAITGGRNMAAEYYDYNHTYNFRDRDVLILGQAARDVLRSFERFWRSGLSADVEQLYQSANSNARDSKLTDAEVKRVYRTLHEYASLPGNFAPEVRAAIAAAPASFPRLAHQVAWGDVRFISDLPGKNAGREGLGGGGASTSALAQLVRSSQKQIVIQSPYLVLSDQAMDLFRQTINRGVRVRVNTNSLASTDNMHAFSGYRNQRDDLLELGMHIFEYKPDPEAQRSLMPGRMLVNGKRPVFAVHAKTMVIDSRIVYIGTFNFDPRSENLNTEVGAIIENEALARAVEVAIETDMQPANSWNAATDDPDRHVSWSKRAKVRFWQLMPMKPLL